MNSTTTPHRDESPSAQGSLFDENPSMFQLHFERSADAIWLFDPQAGVFVNCNQAAVELMRAGSKEKLLQMRPEDLSPALQPDGTPSSEKTVEIVALIEQRGGHRFEWVARRFDGQDVPLEVLATPIQVNGQNLHVIVSRDITERKKTERQLLELNQSLERRVTERTSELSASEAKFRALFEGCSQGVVLHNENEILEVNPAAVRIMGRQFAHEMIGKHPREMSPPFQPNGESSDLVAGKFIDECMTKGSARFDWMAADPTGREIPMEVMLTRIEWSGRQIIQAFITDISERKRAQSALAESEALFSAAFEGSPILIVIARMSDEKYVLVNDAFVNWSGCAREEILGRNSSEFGIWESQAERDAVWADLRRDHSIHERECRFRNRRGDLTTMLISFEVIQINHAPHVLAMGLDISARKEAEAASSASEARLRESEARFSAAFHASPALIGILRISDEQYVLANEAYLNWLGYAQEEVLGRTCVELGLWENSADRDTVLSDMRTTGSIRQKECRWKNRRGERFTVLLSAEAIKLNDTPHMISMAIDITQRKRAEEELLKTLEREKELSQLKSNFVSMVSHEFRTPLGIIQSSAELLRDFYQKMPPAEREEQLKSVVRNTRRMAGMMEEVLILSRLDAGKLYFQPTTINLSGFCRRVVDEVLSATNRRSPIELSLASIPLEAKADERLLNHIFTNLLSNAVKYSEPGATVSFAVERDRTDAVCIVQDHGIGISIEDQQHLFKAFHRGGNVGTRPGTGLGLLVVKRCLELHCGDIRLTSKLGEGTTVTVRLPVFEKDL